MLNITSYGVETMKDPFGILSGERYEFFLDIEVPEDDELYTEDGIYVRVIYGVDESHAAIIKYEIFDAKTEKMLDFELEEDEEKAIEIFCKEHYSEALNIDAEN